MLDLYDKIQEACDAIRKRWDRKPHAGIILGTGLGPLVEKINVQETFDYAEIPHFLKSTATSHRGRLVCGELCGVPVVAMEGRFHMYEGYPLKQITLPVRVMNALGASLLLVSNACGGMNPNHRAGDILFIEDHINLMGDNPLIGVNDDRLGPRFPDMSEPYDHALIEEGLRVAQKRHSSTPRRFRRRQWPQPRNACRIQIPSLNRCRCGRNVNRSRSYRSSALRYANRRLFRHHRYVLARCTRASRCPKNHRHCKPSRS